MRSTRRDAHIRFLKLQVELLKDRLLGNRVVLDPDERRRLMKIGDELDHKVEDTIEIVSIKTYRRWQREKRGGRELGKVGRPGMTKSLRELIIRLAKENAGWGVRRIVGELKKLALRTSCSSVRRVLRRVRRSRTPSSTRTRERGGGLPTQHTVWPVPEARPDGRLLDSHGAAASRRLRRRPAGTGACRPSGSAA